MNLDKINKALKGFRLGTKHIGNVKAGDITYHEGQFRTVIADGWEQGSGPNPSRYFLAFTDDARVRTIIETRHNEVVVLVPVPAEETP